MHNAAFKALGMVDWRYDAMAIPPDIAPYAVREPKRHGYIGLNVTVPFKETALSWGKPDDKARAIGAVNTIDLREDTSTNTDVDGFMGDLRAHDVALVGRAIVLGAGGAARAAVYGLHQQGMEIAIVNRTPQRAHQMLDALAASAGVKNVQVLSLQEAATWDAQLVVNSTSAGMWPNAETTPWAEDVPFPEGITLYDMVYTPAQTRLMQQCQRAGGRAIGGLGMLARQGAVAFEIWTGVQPPIDIMLETLRTELSKRETKD